MHVLIATDGTPASTLALSTAASMFGSSAAYTVVSVGTPIPLHAVSPLGLRPLLLTITGDPDTPLGNPVGAAESAVAGAEEVLPDQADVEIVIEVGSPGETICRIAEDRAVDVIVVGHHERGWLSRLVEPSTTAHVVDHAPCHVLVARAADDSA